LRQRRRASARAAARRAATATASRAGARNRASGRPSPAGASTAGASTAASTLALLRTASLATAAQQEIERLVLSGEIAPGTQLTEVWLAQRLGVSRGPLREAFRMLEEAGLVRQERNRGVFVRDIPLAEALEIFDLRAAMDDLVGRRLAESATAAQLCELKQLVQQMEQAVRAADIDAYHMLNLEFHDRLVEFAGNRKLAAVYRRLVKELALFRRRNLADRNALPQSVLEHRRILKAIASGDAEAAGRVMFMHVMQSRDRVLRAQAPQPRSARGKPAPRKAA
jgi:phosphonate utilization transcriptional regulator